MEDKTVLENTDSSLASSFSQNTLFSSSDPPTSIADGSGYSCALLESASMVCWGDNGHGNFGDGTTGGNTNILREVNFPINSGTPSSMALDNYNGGSFTCAVMDDGDVYTMHGKATVVHQFNRVRSLNPLIVRRYANFTD